MDRRTFAIASIATCALPTIGVGKDTSDKSDSLHDFRFGETKNLEIKSTPVKWQGGDVHLLTLGKFEFSLDRNSNWLSARVNGSLLTFDNIDYTIGIAVFRADGTMLGVSTVICHVPRIWLGVYAKQPVDLKLDFGVSNNYPNGSKFKATISDRTVLTPDQWQKG